MECLAYYSFDEMRSIDLRHYREMSLADYIRLHQPDIVVGIRDYEALLSADYNGSPFVLRDGGKRKAALADRARGDWALEQLRTLAPELRTGWVPGRD